MTVALIEEATKPAMTYPTFKWIRSQKIDSLNITVEEYQHQNTGALHYHIAADNSENVFLVALRTVPTDSRGVAHILEHTALCGSEKYAVRDPFFMMIRRSLNTFMNAFTSSDWTAYPFASQNRKDFNNLLDVYLDAVFFSRLDEYDFAQEGHRLEFEKPDDASTDLKFKGVVFNEMKGAMSSTVSVLWQTVTKYLFPTTTYHFNSGGEPTDIPDLTYQQLKEFYRVHYHPSNAVFMTFGDIPAEIHQEKFENQVLSRFSKLDREIIVDDEKRYFAPVNIEESYALEEGEEPIDKTHLVLAWLLDQSIDLEKQLEAHFLSSVLLENSASPLLKALETTELGSAPSPLCGLEESNKEMSFLCGLEGSSAEHAQAFETLVLKVLNDVVEKGVAQEQLDAVLHQLELSQREIGGDGYPFGLQLILSGLSSAIHHGDVIGSINLDPAIEKLRNKVKDPEYIKQLVKNKLLDNPHRVRLTLKPDLQLGKRREEAEKARLARIKSELDEKQKQHVIELAEKLAARQLEKDDESVLPKVTIDDVPETIKVPECQVTINNNLKINSYSQGTNGIVYQQLLIDLPDLDEQEYQLMPLLTNCIGELGCGDKDYLQMQVLQAGVTGGINAYSTMRGGIANEQQAKGYFVLSGKSLNRNHKELNSLLEQVFRQTRFDEHERIRELISQYRARKEQSITGSGHALAMQAASSGMSPVSRLTHLSQGLSGIAQLKKLDDSLTDPEALEALVSNLNRLHHKLLQAPLQFLLVSEADIQADCINDISQLWDNHSVQLPGDNFLALEPVRETVKQLWLTNTQVNFCAKSYPTVAVEHPDAAPLTVLGGFLKNGYLHRAIREQGGAYGSGANHDSANACFTFFSYRDPRLEGTLNDFDLAVEWLLNEQHEYQSLEEAILGVISQIDKPGSPAGEAKQAFSNQLFGRDTEQRKAFRQRILHVTIDDLVAVTKKYLQPEYASIAVVSSQSIVDEQGDFGMTVYNL